MLSDYLPRLPPRDGLRYERLPREVIKAVQSATSLRNTLTHTGRGSVTLVRVGEILDLVRSILQDLDFYRGFAWSPRIPRS
jgi:hypothetical protein